MRQIIVTGRLGADAEVHQTQQGTTYFTCHLANNEYGDKEGDTHWYRVTSYNYMHIKNVHTFKKGSSVIIIGRYDDHTYISRNGTTEISRDIIANSIEYNNVGRITEDNQTNQSNVQTTQQSVQTAQPRTPVMPKMAPFKPVTEAPKQPQVVSQTTVEQSSVKDEPDDDLPF